MTIRWNGKIWLLKPSDITVEEYGWLFAQGFEPEYYDNWKEGDIYMYDKRLPVGNLMETLSIGGFTLTVESERTDKNGRR